MHDHSALVKHMVETAPDEGTLKNLSSLFKVFGDLTRMRILYALWESEMCVCALAEYLGMTQSAVSHQLKVLRQNNLVGTRREGKTVFYHLADEHVRTIVAQGWEHLTEERKEPKK